jgi:hypothetical protein
LADVEEIIAADSSVGSGDAEGRRRREEAPGGRRQSERGAFLNTPLLFFAIAKYNLEAVDALIAAGPTCRPPTAAARLP